MDLEEGDQHLFIVGYYIPHKGSYFYEITTQIRKEDPMEELEQEMKPSADYATIRNLSLPMK